MKKRRRGEEREEKSKLENLILAFKKIVKEKCCRLMVTMA